MAGLRPRGPRHATIVAYLALFVALGGSAYAANEWTGANIVDGSLTGADIQGNNGTVSTPAVNGSITTFDVAGQAANAANGTPFVDGTLTTWDIKDHSLREDDLAAGSIGNTQLGSDAVSGDKVSDGSLSGADLAAGSIGATQLGSDAVSGDKVADGSLSGADLADGSIGGTQLGADAVSGDKVADGGLSGADVLDESLTNADIGPSAVGTSEIATDGVGATEVQDNSIDSGEIVDNSLGAADLAPGSVGTSELAANAVADGSKVADNSLTLSDIKGANDNGAVSFTAGGIPIGGCKDFSITTPGTKVGEAVVISLRGAVVQGMLFYGVGVAVDNQTIMKVCNFTGASSPLITNLPIKTVTFG